jgi:chemotaxis protein MotB
VPEPVRPIIVIRKKGGHGGHHGGAWKVAYADFVTAMMSLFIVLWLMNTSKPIQEAVGGYFRDPTGTSKKVGNGELGAGESVTLTKENMSKLKEELQKAIQRTINFDKLKDQINMTITPEGLRIELMESAAGTFFQSGVAAPTDNGKEILVKLAEELGKLPNTVSIEGHTDSKPYSSPSGYSNWELSSDRANMARRLMQQSGLGPKQVSQVRGYADQRLRKVSDPEDPSNRRISVIVQYLAKPEGDKPAATPNGPPGAPPAIPKVVPPAAAVGGTGAHGH